MLLTLPKGQPPRLKHMNNFGAWNFLYSGTENREFSTPRTPFSQIPPQAAPRVPAPRPGSPRVLRAASEQIPFLFRIRTPARPLRSCRRAAGAIRGVPGGRQPTKTAQRKRLRNETFAQQFPLRGRHSRKARRGSIVAKGPAAATHLARPGADIALTILFPLKNLLRHTRSRRWLWEFPPLARTQSVSQSFRKQLRNKPRTFSRK